MGEQSGDKTEEPTPHKLREARKKGQVAKSKEITTAILVLVSYYVFKSTAGHMWHYMVDFPKQLFELIPHSEYVLSMAFAVEMVWHGIIIFFLITAPIFLTTFVVAILVEGAQTGFNFSSESLTPKLEKLNPIEGIKRMFSVKGLVQIVISLIKIIIVAWITWNVIKDKLPEILGLMALPHWSLMLLAAQLLFEIAMKVGLFYILIAIFDYFYQRQAFKKSMMMTKQEVKEEYKRLEGDPTIKQRPRQIQREMAQKRQMGQVPKALGDAVRIGGGKIHLNSRIDRIAVSVADALPGGNPGVCERARKGNARFHHRVVATGTQHVGGCRARKQDCGDADRSELRPHA